MGYYDVLLAPRETHRMVKRHAEVGAWIATPGWLAEQTEKLRAEWTVIGKEIHAEYNEKCLGVNNPNVDSLQCQKMRRFMEDVWLPMSKRFYAFAEHHADASYAKLVFRNFWGSVWDQIKEWRNHLIAIHDQAREAGFYFISPKPMPPEPTPWDNTYTVIKWVVGALIGFAAIFALTGLVRAFRG